MGFSSPPSLFGNICGGIYSRSELRRRSGGASYTKSGGRFGACPAGLSVFPSQIATVDGILIGWSLKCVRSLTSFSVCSIVAVIFSGFARASMCIIFYISRGSLEVRLHFSPLRVAGDKKVAPIQGYHGVMICDSMNDLFTVNDKTAPS